MASQQWMLDLGLEDPSIDEYIQHPFLSVHLRLNLPALIIPDAKSPPSSVGSSLPLRPTTSPIRQPHPPSFSIFLVAAPSSIPLRPLRRLERPLLAIPFRSSFFLTWSYSRLLRPNSHLCSRLIVLLVKSDAPLSSLGPSSVSLC